MQILICAAVDENQARIYLLLCVFSLGVPREGLCLQVQSSLPAAKYMEFLFFYQQNISHLTTSFSCKDAGLEHHFFEP